MEEPFVPFNKPYGMSDEDFEEEVRIAQNFHDLWIYQQSSQQLQDEQNRIYHEEDLWYEILKEEMEQTSYKKWYV
jgi:hypothetical protein